MNKVTRMCLLVLIAFNLISINEASSPFFLQAITSALGTIPFTAGPMTSLVGAKLAVGSKLLYYLGFFGRRRAKSRPKQTPPVSSKQRFEAGGGSQFPGGMQAVPLPYAFGAGGFPPQFGAGGFPQFGAGGFPPQFGGGGFPPQAGGFGGGNPNFFPQFPYGYDPAQVFQMLAAQGIDPAIAMQAMGSEGAGSQSISASQFPFSTGANPSSPVATAVQGKIPSESKNPSNEDNPVAEGSDNDVESFFTFLRDMDENTCISRLMCDIGANPSFLGEFSENIHGIIGSLDVLPSSGAFPYIAIMETGRSEGGCSRRFPQCSDAAYEIVKNVAPSVGVPQNINSEIVNQL